MSRDVLVAVADVDMERFVRGVLSNPRWSGAFRDFRVTYVRHPLHDAGMARGGHELVRLYKATCARVVVLLDYHGSGCETRRPAKSAAVLKGELQGKLDGSTWKGRSEVAVVEPELERWLWCCESAVRRCLGVDEEGLREAVGRYCAKAGVAEVDAKARWPKELYGAVVRGCGRSLSAAYFEEVGRLADVQGLMKCASFAELVGFFRGVGGE